MKSITRSARSSSACTSTEGGGRRVLKLRQPASEQGSQREGRLVAPPKSVPALVRAAGALRDPSRGADEKLYTVDFRLVNDKGRGAPRKVNDASAQDFVVDTGSENTVITRTDGAEAGDYAGHVHAERGRRPGRPPRPPARAHRLARARIAQAAQRPVSDQESAPAGYPDQGNRRALTARAWLLDGDRLQDAQAHVREAPARRAERLRAADARPIASPPCAARSTIDRRTSSSTQAARVISISSATATSLGKPEDRPADRAEGLRHVGMGPDAFPDAGRRSHVRHDCVQELSGGRPESERAERPARLSARWHRRTQVSE